MIEEIEIAPSGRAKCRWCNNLIGKGTPRGIESEYHNNHSEQHYFCYKCIPKKIESDIDSCQRMIRRLRNFLDELENKIKENSQAIVLNEIK